MRIWSSIVGAGAVAWALTAAPAWGTGASSEPLDPETPERGPIAALAHALKDNRFGALYGTLRPRYEYANVTGADEANALTLRAVLGFGSRSFHGLSFRAEGEWIASADEDWYFNGAGDSNGRSLIADPRHLGVNQLYGDYEHDEWATRLRVGRQRVILDDARFVGDVAWRQNDQTFDAVRFETGLGRRDWSARYVYLGRVLRVFGNRGRRATRDFDSDSHLVNLRWSGLDALRVTAFAYRIDLDEAERESSSSYGTRLDGELELPHDAFLRYAASYAFQQDAANNPEDYRAHYAWVDAGVGHEALGFLGAGFELLGSDDGDASFRTPLGTLHTFNGFADAFLDNGGDDGLRDFFVRVRPALPWRLEGEIAVHRFRSDQGNRSLGWELDAVLSRPLGSFATVLAKAAWFDSSESSRESVVRAWLQVTFSF